jgi:hypothetical protein
MKISSNLLKAMLLSATIGVTAAGCKTQKVNPDAQSKQERPHHDPNACPACGMG